VTASTELVLAAPSVEVSPGVYAPDRDSQMLLETFQSRGPATPSLVLDVCTGSGIQAIAAAQLGHRVVAVDIEREAVIATRRNAWASGVEIETCEGDLFEPVRGWRFDVVLANPPYVPTPQGAEHAKWCDGGADGREVIDRICREARSVLAARGKLWMVHSSLADIELTLARLDEAGFSSEIVAREDLSLGPVSMARRDHLIAGGHLQADELHEELAVIEARARA
jgi:release factor glutamine methyltransferase